MNFLVCAAASARFTTLHLCRGIALTMATLFSFRASWLLQHLIECVLLHISPLQLCRRHCVDHGHCVHPGLPGYERRASAERAGADS
jgi:hypothetical protein